MIRDKEKNVMRTPEEKLNIVNEYYSNNLGYGEICNKYNISRSVLWRWLNNYKQNGFSGLISNTGKSKTGKGLHLRDFYFCNFCGNRITFDKT